MEDLGSLDIWMDRMAEELRARIEENSVGNLGTIALCKMFLKGLAPRRRNCFMVLLMININVCETGQKTRKFKDLDRTSLQGRLLCLKSSVFQVLFCLSLKSSSKTYFW